VEYIGYMGRKIVSPHQKVVGRNYITNFLGKNYNHYYIIIIKMRSQFFPPARKTFQFGMKHCGMGNKLLE